MNFHSNDLHKNRMKVRIGIITRNRASILPKAIDSALAQDHPDKEVVVYDIASTDGTPAIVSRYPEVQWLRSEKRLDMISPKNHLMSNSDADFYFSLDDDAWFLTSDQLSAGVEIMRQNPDVAILAYDIVLPGETFREQKQDPVQTHVFVACGALLRRSALEEVGYYHGCPAMYGGGEETDLCLKLLDAGYRTLLWPGQHVYHERTSVGRDLFDQHRSMMCNQLGYLVMRCPLPLLLCHFPWRITSQFIFSLKMVHLKAYLSGMGILARSIGKLFASRSPVSCSTYVKHFRMSRQTAAR